MASPPPPRPRLPDRHKFACLALQVPQIDPTLAAVTPFPGAGGGRPSPGAPARPAPTTPAPAAPTPAPATYAALAAPHGLPEHWEDWLGSLEVERIRGANLFLVATAPSATPDVLDAENTALWGEVRRLHAALLVATPGVRIDYARLVTGAVRDGRPGVRQSQELDRVARPLGTPRSWGVTRTSLAAAADVAAGLAEVGRRAADPDDHFGRLRRAVTAFHAMARSTDLEVRLHQAVRVVEALVCPPFDEKGTTGYFSSQGAFFLGGTPADAALMRELYQLRGKVEHLHGAAAAARAVWPAVPDDREAEVRFAAANFTAEAVAHLVLTRVLGRPRLLEHFRSDAAIRAFWAMKQKRDVWGPAGGEHIRAVMAAFDRAAAARNVARVAAAAAARRAAAQRAADQRAGAPRPAGALGAAFDDDGGTGADATPPARPTPAG